MRRIKGFSIVILAGVLLAACGGSAPDSPTPSMGAPGVSIVTLPQLPADWARYEVPGEFTVGIPETWLVLTAAERDDAAAAQALKARYPDYTEAIDSTIAQMREQGLMVHAFDIGGDTSVFTTNMNILKVAGPLDATFATASAAVVQAQFSLADPLNVEVAASPAGSYRYQFAQDLHDDSIAGIQYLIPVASDVYVLTFLTTVKQTTGYGPTALSMADTFAVSDSGTPSGPAADPIAQATEFFRFSNEDAVSGGGKPLYLFTESAVRVTSITTRHDTSGGLDRTGTISIQDYKTGAVLFGPFEAVGRAGPDGSPNGLWTVNVDFILPAGEYLVVDSEPATWAQNEGTSGVGMAWGTGINVESAARGPSVSDGLTVQGETAALANVGTYTEVVDATDRPDTRGGYLYLADGGATASFDVTIPEDGTYTMWIRVSDDGLQNDGDRNVTVAAGQNTRDWVHVSRDTNGWVYSRVGEFGMSKGTEQVVFTKTAETYAAFDLDEFILSSDPAYQP